jgi:hypothetical protein
LKNEKTIPVLLRCLPRESQLHQGFVEPEAGLIQLVFNKWPGN